MALSFFFESLRSPRNIMVLERVSEHFRSGNMASEYRSYECDQKGLQEKSTANKLRDYLGVFCVLCVWGLQGKKLQKQFMHLLSFLGHFCCTFMEIIGLKSPGNYSGPFWSYNFSICLWDNPQIFISMILVGTCVNLFPSPKTNLIYLLRNQDTLTKIKRNPCREG